LDDFSLGGNVAIVAQDVRRIVDLVSKMGLFLNTAAKCKLIGHYDLVADDPCPAMWRCLAWGPRSFKAKFWITSGLNGASTSPGQWAGCVYLAPKTH